MFSKSFKEDRGIICSPYPHIHHPHFSFTRDNSTQIERLACHMISCTTAPPQNLQTPWVNLGTLKQISLEITILFLT